MQKFIALLRGINVGGHRKILMADLKELFVEMNLNNAVTYIQSGNVIFESENSNCSELELIISKAILNTFGYTVPVIVKTLLELESILNDNPFCTGMVDQKKLHVTFMNTTPLQEDIKNVQNVDFGEDKFLIRKNVIFIYVEGAYHKTKISNQFFEKKLKVSTTTRNWKTTNKLLELASK